MSGKDRRPHETATTLDQEFLDYSQDNLENNIQTIVEIERPQGEETRYSCVFTVGSPGVVFSPYHPFIEGDQIIFETTDTLPPELSSGTTYYVRNPSNGDFNLSTSPTNPLLDFTGSGSGINNASHSSGLLRVSDRNTFVGNRFYEARAKIPIVNRTIGEWLRPVIEFSSLQLDLNNVDGLFSGMIPGGDNYEGQINKEVNIKMGIRDVESTYFTIFKGFVSETGGFKRDITSVKYVARDRFDQLNIKFPNTFFNLVDYPKISDDVLGLAKPVIFGDYTENVETEGNIPAQLVNKSDPQVFFEKELPVNIVNGSPSTMQLDNHNLDNDDRIHFTTDGSLPSPLLTGTNYYVIVVDSNYFRVSTSPGGGAISTTGGIGQHNIICQDLVNIQCVISETYNQEFDTSEVWLKRSDIFYKMSSDDIVNVSGSNNYFEISQNTGNTIIDGSNYTFDSNDIFLLKVRGYFLGAGLESNAVSQAREILTRYTNLTSSDFDSNWDTYRDKSTPAISSISTIKSRAWIQKQTSALQYALSLLEQVRLEAFISRDLLLKINSLHLEDFESNPSYTVRNFDVEKDSLSVSIDERNNFNRSQAFYDFNPNLGENNRTTGVFINQASIDQDGKEIFKTIEFPNLYIASEVESQLSEILRISSSKSEFLSLTMTGRQLLKDIGGFVKVNIQIGSTVYENIPMMIREIGYGSDLKLRTKLWSWQMIPFANPGGWNPGYNGIVGGDTATITEE